jgi:hypothetical protein
MIRIDRLSLRAMKSKVGLHIVYRGAEFDRRTSGRF